jgi:hypothetical protein
MAQGYLNDLAAVASGIQLCSLRVRIAGDAARSQHQVAGCRSARASSSTTRLPVADADELLAQARQRRACSTRCGTTSLHAGHLWEVDEFLKPATPGLDRGRESNWMHVDDAVSPRPQLAGAAKSPNCSSLLQSRGWPRRPFSAPGARTQRHP